jgi:hypothetical protein
MGSYFYKYDDKYIEIINSLESRICALEQEKKAKQKIKFRKPLKKNLQNDIKTFKFNSKNKNIPKKKIITASNGTLFDELSNAIKKRRSNISDEETLYTDICNQINEFI